MAFALHHDFFVPRESELHHWPARTKLICLLAMMFAIALVKNVVLLPWVAIAVGWIYYRSRLPLMYLLKRLPYPGVFILATVLLLPLTSGTSVVWQWGWLAIRYEGLLLSLLIAGRFLSIVVIGFILLGSTPFLDILRAMRSLKVPPLLTDMLLLTYRYLFEVVEQFNTMRQAMKLRGYGHQSHSLRHRWSLLTSLFGSLLIRSYDQSQRVYQAMILRGYGQGRYVHARSASPPKQNRKTGFLTVSTMTFSLSLILAQWSLSLQ